MGTQFKVLGYDLRIFIMLSHVTFHISSAVMTMSLLFGLVMGALPPRPRKWTVGEIIRIKVNPFAASEYPRFEGVGRIKYHDECDGKVTAVSITHRTHTIGNHIIHFVISSLHAVIKVLGYDLRIFI